jgi:hypothetical protein
MPLYRRRTIPAGSDKQVQFNDSGAFGGDAGLVYDKTTDALTLAGQLIISGAAAGQIVFPGTQNASANANTLDDYEEGTWTPTITFGGAGTGITYSQQSGIYRKVGSLVWVSAHVVLTNNGSSAGTMRIVSLPFTPTDTGVGVCFVATGGAGLPGSAGATGFFFSAFAGTDIFAILDTGVFLTDANTTDTFDITVSALYYL